MAARGKVTAAKIANKFVVFMYSSKLNRNDRTASQRLVNTNLRLLRVLHLSWRSSAAYRCVGVCKASSTPSRPPDHYSRVEKQSYFPRRRYANTPTRFPSRRPILNATPSLLYARRYTSTFSLAPKDALASTHLPLPLKDASASRLLRLSSKDGSASRHLFWDFPSWIIAVPPYLADLKR